METAPPRWILHLDMDAFFASVEQLDKPELKGRPVIIGGGKRGVVSTASYEARVFGVHSAMPMFQARKLCPQGVFLPGRMARYQEKSREVMGVLTRFSPLVEKASIDEAYVDATGLERLFLSVETMAHAVQAEVLAQTGLTCSIGLAPVKFLAKIASDMRKPAGLTILSHAETPAFLTTLPVGKIPGVGTQMQKKLDLLGVRLAGDVQRLPRGFWVKHLGKAGAVLFDRAGGIDPRSVVLETVPKSESAENTFARDTVNQEELSAWLLHQSERVGQNLRKQHLAGRTITLKLKYADFTQRSKSRTLKEPTNATRVVYETALALLAESRLDRPLRLIGVAVSHFGAEAGQIRLFPEPGAAQKKRDAALDALLDELRDRFGKEVVVRGKLFKNYNTKLPTHPQK